MANGAMVNNLALKGLICVYLGQFYKIASLMSEMIYFHNVTT